jgi:hypothetical protein
VARLDHLPGLLNLLFERRDRALVILRQLKCRLDLRCVGNDLAVELLALLDQALFALMRLLERTVQLLILLAEALEALVANKLSEDLHTHARANERGQYAVLFLPRKQRV